MAEAPNGGGRRETAAWAIGAGTLSLITGWAGAVQVIQEPLERDIASINRRLDEAILTSSDARSDIREQFRQAVEDVLMRSDERLIAVGKQQAQVNSSYGTALGEMAVRINRMEQRREEVLPKALSQLQRIEDHMSVIDNRLNEVEQNFVRVLRGDAIRPDRSFEK
jgi:parvulin-like peptidyl-prolyl isomerase